jgi:uncharacterized membrane protein YsdA (DUF1294 family)/cold shock CspA family protein
MRFEGHLKSWNPERGFGFVEPSEGGQEIFLHINAVPTKLRPPKVGQAFSFEVELNREGKKRAANVGVPQVVRRARAPQPRSTAPWSLASMLAIPLFLLLFIAVAVVWRVSPWIPVAYLFLSIACIFAYHADKSAARHGRWRVSEQSLLFLGLAGGWPGALIAQQLFRHKSSKASFRSAFWGTVLLNAAGFVLIHSPLASGLNA